MARRPIPADAGHEKADLESALNLMPAEQDEADGAPQAPDFTGHREGSWAAESPAIDYEFSMADLLADPMSVTMRRRTAARFKKGQRSIRTEKEYRDSFASYVRFLALNPNTEVHEKHVKRTPEPPSITDFCRYIGISRETFYRYERDDPAEGEEWLRDVTKEIAEDLLQRRANRAMRRVYDPNFVARYDRIAEVTEQVVVAMPQSDPFAEMKQNVANAQAALSRVEDKADEDDGSQESE